MQTDGRIVYNVAAHTQGDMSRDMCRGSSLDWSSVLVRVFSANSSDKLNLRQPGVDTIIEYSQELSRLSEEDVGIWAACPAGLATATQQPPTLHL